MTNKSDLSVITAQLLEKEPFDNRIRLQFLNTVDQTTDWYTAWDRQMKPLEAAAINSVWEISYDEKPKQTGGVWKTVRKAVSKGDAPAVEKQEGSTSKPVDDGHVKIPTCPHGISLRNSCQSCIARLALFKEIENKDDKSDDAIYERWEMYESMFNKTYKDEPKEKQDITVKEAF